MFRSSISINDLNSSENRNTSWKLSSPKSFLVVVRSGIFTRSFSQISWTCHFWDTAIPSIGHPLHTISHLLVSLKVLVLEELKFRFRLYDISNRSFITLYGKKPFHACTSYGSTCWCSCSLEKSPVLPPNWSNSFRSQRHTSTLSTRPLIPHCSNIVWCNWARR